MRNLKIEIAAEYQNNQLRIANREALFEILHEQIQHLDFDFLSTECLKHDVPIGKIRNLKEVFELPEAQELLNSFDNNGKQLNSVRSIAFKFL